MKVLLFAVIAMVMLSGCVNKVKVDCPSCIVQSDKGAVSYECTECTIDGQMYEDMSLIEIGRD